MNSRWVLIRLHITSCVEVNIVLKDLDLMRNSILNGESPNKTEFKVLKYWTVKIFCLGQSLNINSQLVFFFLFLNWSLSLKTSSVLEFNQMDQFHCSWLGAETFIILTELNTDYLESSEKNLQLEWKCPGNKPPTLSWSLTSSQVKQSWRFKGWCWLSTFQ